MVGRASLVLAIWAAVAVGSAARVLGTEPPPPSVSSGSWQLVPVTTMPAPAAWVFDTATGSAFFCMVAANDKKAGVGCLAVYFPKRDAKEP
jgi:hypothetical protein